METCTGPSPQPPLHRCPSAENPSRSSPRRRSSWYHLHTHRVGAWLGQGRRITATQRRQRVQSRWCEVNGRRSWRRSQKLDEQCTTIQQARTEPRHHSPMLSTTQAKEATCIVKEAGVTGKLRHTTVHLARRVLAEAGVLLNPKTVKPHTHPVHAQTPQPPNTL